MVRLKKFSTNISVCLYFNCIGRFAGTYRFKAMEELQKMREHIIGKLSAASSDSLSIPDDILTALDVMHPSTLEHALQLIDSNSVSCVFCASGRFVYRVLGSNGTPYYCLRTLEYCPCAAFHYSTINRGEAFTCKHLLAVELMRAITVLQQEQVSDEQMENIIASIE